MTRKRSTRRRQDAPDLPTRQMRKTTLGRQYAGKYRPSMFFTLTCDSYGPVRDGAPVDPATYDYRRAARDALHFAALVDRFMQNLRRVARLGRAVLRRRRTPEARLAPHLHLAIRGTIPAPITRRSSPPPTTRSGGPPRPLVYASDHDGRPVWDEHAAPTSTRTPASPARPGTRPSTPSPTTTSAAGHVVRFGDQFDAQGRPRRHRGGRTPHRLPHQVPDQIGQRNRRTRHRRAAAAHERLHAELAITPCSERCANWLRYGIVPQGATAKRYRAGATARPTAAAPSDCPDAGCWSRANGPARPSPTIGPIVRNLFGNSSPTRGSANLCVIRPEC